MSKRMLSKSLLCLVLFAGILYQAKAEEVNYDPIKTQVALNTAECMYDWIQGSLNRGARDREAMVGQAVYMCSTVALKFGWTKPEMTVLANRVFVTVPGVSRK